MSFTFGKAEKVNKVLQLKAFMTIISHTAQCKAEQKFELIRNADLVCTDCLYKYDDTNMPCNVSKCEMYEEKPSTVIDGGNCDLYDKGVSE